MTMHFFTTLILSPLTVTIFLKKVSMDTFPSLFVIRAIFLCKKMTCFGRDDTFFKILKHWVKSVHAVFQLFGKEINDYIFDSLQSYQIDPYIVPDTYHPLIDLVFIIYGKKTYASTNAVMFDHLGDKMKRKHHCGL